MARLVVSDKPKPRLEIAEPRTRRRITPEEIEEGLGAESAGQVPSGGSPISAYAVRQELFRRLRSTGGRPALDGADVRPKIPMRQSQWQKLERLAERVESGGFHPSPAQLASIILDAGIDEYERAPDAKGEKAPERYFYHSFPRRNRETAAEIKKGCQILSIMRDVGLVMAPEIVKWEYEHADGSLPRTSEVLQQRVCFTELEPHELHRHAQKFGRFALEFTVPTLKSLGAIPVFYIPRAMSAATGAEGAGNTLVMQFIDAMILVMRIAGVRNAIVTSGQQEGTFPCTFGFKESGNKTFDLKVGETMSVLEAFTHAITPPDMLLPALEGMLKFFYPADDLRHDEVLGYYREREWRIAGNVAIRGVEMMRRPSPELIERLKALDDNFFGREFPPKSGRSLADEVFVLPGLGDKRILQMVNRVIVPEKAISKVQAMLKDLPDAPAIVPLESLETRP